MPKEYLQSKDDCVLAPLTIEIAFDEDESIKSTWPVLTRFKNREQYDELENEGFESIHELYKHVVPLGGVFVESTISMNDVDSPYVEKYGDSDNPVHMDLSNMKTIIVNGVERLSGFITTPLHQLGMRKRFCDMKWSKDHPDRCGGVVTGSECSSDEKDSDEEFRPTGGDESSAGESNTE